MRDGLRSKGQPCRLNETRQLRRLETGGTGTHVEFHPVGEHEAYPGFSLREEGRAALWGYLRGAHWRSGYPIEPRRDLSKWHTSLLQLADMDESFQVRQGIVWSPPCPERRGQEPTLDVVTHSAACDSP